MRHSFVFIVLLLNIKRNCILCSLRKLKLSRTLCSIISFCEEMSSCNYNGYRKEELAARWVSHSLTLDQKRIYCVDSKLSIKLESIATLHRQTSILNSGFRTRTCSEKHRVHRLSWTKEKNSLEVLTIIIR